MRLSYPELGYPCKTYKEESDNNFDHLAKPAIFALLLTKHLFDDLADSMHTSPDDECPIGTMPNAAYEKRHKDVPVVTKL